MRRRGLLYLLPVWVVAAGPAVATPPSGRVGSSGLMVLVLGPDVGALQVARLAAVGRGIGLQPRRIAATRGTTALRSLIQAWQHLDRNGPPGPVVVVAQGEGARLATRMAADLDTGPRPLLLWLLGAAGDAGFPRDDLARFEARCAATERRSPALLMVEGDADLRMDVRRRRLLLDALPSATVIGIPGASQQDLLAERGYRDALSSLLRGWVRRSWDAEVR